MFPTQNFTLNKKLFMTIFVKLSTSEWKRVKLGKNGFFAYNSATFRLNAKVYTFLDSSHLAQSIAVQELFFKCCFQWEKDKKPLKTGFFLFYCSWSNNKVKPLFSCSKTRPKQFSIKSFLKFDSALKKKKVMSNRVGGQSALFQPRTRSRRKTVQFGSLISWEPNKLETSGKVHQNQNELFLPIRYQKIVFGHFLRKCKGPFFAFLMVSPVKVYQPFSIITGTMQDYDTVFTTNSWKLRIFDFFYILWFFEKLGDNSVFSFWLLCY